ncbi:MAG: DNA-directed RNA polymerase subunit P [Candidatus Micrarchaeia archaeon]|jgi:DNA-directed RNA polymerase subunit RPC12/RpoP
MAYVCLNCGKKIKDISNFVRCPYCGYRVVVKERSSLAREVSTD